MPRPCSHPSRVVRPALLGVAALTTAVLLSSCSPVPPLPRNPEASPSSTQPVATQEPTRTPEQATSAPASSRPPGDDNGQATPSPTAGYESTGLEDAVIEPAGVGPIRIGMSLAEARAHGWAARSEVCDKWDASPELVDRGLSMTFVDDALYEIWVHEPEFATEAGITVGDTLSDVKDAYGDELRTELRDGGGGRLPAWFVIEDEHELLFVEQDPGQDERIKSILARTHGTDVIEGC